ncbi:hypothetical protein LINGRAHAP2_LOCUS19452 [Linum grandiflorum]
MVHFDPNLADDFVSSNSTLCDARQNNCGQTTRSLVLACLRRTTSCKLADKFVPTVARLEEGGGDLFRAWLLLPQMPVDGKEKKEEAERLGFRLDMSKELRARKLRNSATPINSLVNGYGPFGSFLRNNSTVARNINIKCVAFHAIYPMV